jgi:superfamily II DNA or RNA helicase
MLYPNIEDSVFYDVISSKKEFYDNRRSSSNLKKIDCLQPHQRLLANFINPLTQYNNILVNHQPGLGKTLTSIAIAENFKKSHKAVVFIKNQNLEMNYRKELLNECSAYITNEEREILNKKISPGDYDGEDRKKNIIKKINENINKNYTFHTYGIINDTLNVSNRVVIFDEIHNALGNNIYFEIIKMLKRSYNYKVVLLTATPVYENVNEIFEIANILNVSSTKSLLPIRDSLIKKGFTKKTKNTLENTILNESVTTLTQAGKILINIYLRGKVSYLDINENSKDFAKKIFVGEPISKNPGSINIVKSYFSEDQEKQYVKSLDDKSALFKNSSDISTIAFPDSKLGKEAFDKYIKKDGKNFLNYENGGLKTYSPKLYKILESIKNSTGLIFIYSNYVNNAGTELISSVLKYNGFSQYGSRDNNKKYIVFTDIKSLSKRQKVLKIFNSKENIDGKLIKIIIGSPSISEGISFKNIRHIHILEPHWNLSRIDQIIGRGIRYKSHSDIEEKQRNVKIYLHACISKNKKIQSIDLLKYQLSEQKDIVIKEVSQFLKEISLDCLLNKDISGYKDLSRECNYKKCDYICLGKMKDQIDHSTRDLKIHDPYKYKFILNYIQKLFSKGYAYSYDFIIEKIKKNNDISEDDIIYVFSDVINISGIFKNPNNVKGVLYLVNDIFFINPDEEKINDTFFYKMFEKQTPSSNKALLEIKNSPKKPKVSKEKIDTGNNKIIGIYDGDTFKILDNREEVDNVSDERKLKTGKACSSYSKEILENIVKFLDNNQLTKTDTDKLKKTELCRLIEEKLNKLKLIIKK